MLKNWIKSSLQIVYQCVLKSLDNVVVTDSQHNSSSVDTVNTGYTTTPDNSGPAITVADIHSFIADNVNKEQLATGQSSDDNAMDMIVVDNNEIINEPNLGPNAADCSGSSDDL